MAFGQNHVGRKIGSFQPFLEIARPEPLATAEVRIGLGHQRENLPELRRRRSVRGGELLDPRRLEDDQVPRVPPQEVLKVGDGQGFPTGQHEIHGPGGSPSGCPETRRPFHPIRSGAQVRQALLEVADSLGQLRLAVG